MAKAPSRSSAKMEFGRKDGEISSWKPPNAILRVIKIN